jgi:AraC-like DNA-binding protein
MHDDLRFLHANHFPRCEARVDKHFNGYYTIQYVSQGAVELYYDNDRYVMQKHWYWSAFPGPHIRFHAAPGHEWWEHRYVAVQGPLPERWFAAGLFPRKPVSAPVHTEGAAILDAIHTDMRDTGRWAHMKAVNALERLLIQLSEQEQIQSGSSVWLQDLLSEIRASLNIRFDYEALARTRAMSVVTLRRRFRQAMGVSLHMHVIRERVAEAKRLLAQTDMPVKRIADTLGYENVHFFTRQFAAMEGMPPARFRKSRY